MMIYKLFFEEIMEVKAYAKINLSLFVGAKREDGYHELESYMQSINLFDRIRIERNDSGKISIFCSRPYIPCDERNLAYKAAVRFFDAVGIEDRGLLIDIKKNVPVGAGLGGGSSDAAAVLVALNKLYDTKLSLSELASIAAKIGADVAFCVYGGTYLARGIGEILTPAPPMPKTNILVVKPSFSVPTPQAYGLFDAFGEQEKPDIDGMKTALEDGNILKICASLGNSLQAPVEKEYPKITEIRNALTKLGAGGALMSGAGSSVFGIFTDASLAQKARISLPKAYGQRYICYPQEGIK